MVAAQPVSSPVAPPQPSPGMPYKRVAGLLTQGEYAFWVPLCSAVGSSYHIQCKVRLYDLVRVPDSCPDEKKWFGRVKGYHVDFVLCDPLTLAPLLVIELDDRSHRARSQRQRDEFKARVLADAGLPLCRIRAQQAYAPEEIAQTIARHIAGARQRGTTRPA